MSSTVYCQTTWDWSNDVVFMQNIINGDDDDNQEKSYDIIEMLTDSLENDSIVKHMIDPATASDIPVMESMQPEATCLYLGLPGGPPLILQHTLESYVQSVRCVEYNESLKDAALPYSSHYDIYDEELHEYILTSDKLACSRAQCTMQLCSFCEEPISADGFCCVKYKDSIELSRGKGAVKFRERQSVPDQTTDKVKTENIKSASNKNKESKEVNSEARRLAKERSERRKKERLLAVERANKRRVMNNGLGTNEGTAPSHTPGTKFGQPSTITYQLSSQKCIDDGWTVWPQIAALKYNNRNSQTTAVTSSNHLVNDVTSSSYQENVGEYVISRFYDNSNIFVIIFPEGSGSVFYPSGRLAISIITVSEGVFTYIVQDDCVDATIMAVFLPSGHGVVYHPNGHPRIFLTPFGGEEFDSTGARLRKWIWHDSNSCDTNPITLGVNNCCGVRIISQQNMSLTYSAECRSCRFRIGYQRKKLLDNRKLEPLSLTSGDEIFMKEMKTKFEGLLLKISSVLQFPKSPKLERIPLPSHFKLPKRKLQSV